MRFLRLRELILKIGLARSAIYVRIGDGRLPAPCHLGRAAVWTDEEIEAWMRRVRESGEPPVGTYFEHSTTGRWCTKMEKPI